MDLARRPEKSHFLATRRAILAWPASGNLYNARDDGKNERDQEPILPYAHVGLVEPGEKECGTASTGKSKSTTSGKAGGLSEV